MTDVLDHLRAALSDRYTIERELSRARRALSVEVAMTGIAKADPTGERDAVHHLWRRVRRGIRSCVDVPSPESRT